MATAEIVLETATELYISHGSKVTAAMIADQIGCSRALVRKKYPTRTELMLACLEYQRSKVAPLWADVTEDSSPEHVLLLCISTYQSHPEWYQLLGRLVLDTDEEELQTWIDDRPIWDPIKVVITRLAFDSDEGDWTPESLLIATNLLCVGLSLYGPVFSRWYGLDPAKQHKVEGHVLGQLMKMVRGLKA